MMSISPIWVEKGLAEWGVKQWSSGQNPEVMKYWTAIPGASDYVKTDEVDWCAAYLSWVFDQSGFDANYPWPMGFKNFGTALTGPVPGAIAVSKSAVSQTTGHVGLCITVKGSKFLILGGNQEAKVDLDWYDVANYDFRWPPE